MLSETLVKSSLHQLFERNATQYPGKIALKFDQDTLTYEALNVSANRLARHLMEQGISRGSRVCVLLEPSPSVIISLLALLKIGATYVPIDVEYPVGRIQLILDDINPQGIITRTQFLSLLKAEFKLFFLDDYRNFGCHQFDAHNLDLSLDDSLPAYIFFTSGTTGAPKGVLASRANLVHYTRSAIDSFEMGPHTIMPTIARLSFSISLFELLCPLLAGGEVRILARETILDIPRLASMLPEFTMIHMGPSLLNILTRYIVANPVAPDRFNSLIHVSSGGDIVKPELLERLRNIFIKADIFVVYGCTEIACMGCYFPVSRSTLPTKTTIGKPFPGVSVLFLDGEMQTINYPDWGEIYVAGQGVTEKYLHRAEITALRYVNLEGKRYYRTGDLARQRPDGNIEFLGREDHQIQMHGIRIELGEVEANLMRIPGIKDAIAAGRQDKHGEISLVAYVVLDQHNPADFNAIKLFLETNLPKYMIPSLFVRLDSLPLNHNFKLDRTALPEPVAANILNNVTETVAAQNLVEQQLLEIWINLFERDDIGVTHDFFDLHGDSLLAIELIIAVQKTFSVHLPISQLLLCPTIRSLAEVIADPDTQDTLPSDLFVMRQGDNAPAVFMIHGALVYKDLCDHMPQRQTVCVLYQNDEAESIGRDDVLGLMSTYGSIREIAEHYLKAIRKFQPSGPYYLVGFSIGGLIAMEMSQILLEEDQTVGDLVLIDSHLPHFAKQALSRKILYHLKQIATRGFPHLKYLSWKVLMQFHFMRNGSTAESRAADRATKEELRRQARNNASSYYIPKRFLQKVILFKATQRPEYEVADECLGWRDYLPHLDVVDLSGDHEDLLMGENAVKIALAVTQCQHKPASAY